MCFFRQFFSVWATVFASRLAPTGGAHYNSGSEPAREGAGTHTADFATDGLGRITHNP
jgi:hypothetical protein